MSDAPAIDYSSLPPSTMRQDLLWAYVASGARIGSWAIISAAVYRNGGPREFGTFALIRGTIGILNYTAVGLAPAIVRVLAETRSSETPTPVIAISSDDRLEYRSKSPATLEQIVYSNGLLLAGVSVAIGLVITLVYAGVFNTLHHVPIRIESSTSLVVFCIGLGTLIRLFSDTSGAILQTRDSIALDNMLLAGTEVAWIIFAIFTGCLGAFEGAAVGFLMSSAFLLWRRMAAVARLPMTPWPPVPQIRRDILTKLLAIGSLVLIAQLADYLYAPTDYLLIDRFLGSVQVAAYAPAVQIDAGLLAVVMAISAVLLPKAALAHVAGSTATVRQYYIRGTLASAGLLLSAATVVYLISPFLLRLWLGSDPGTSAILPFVLVHTVIGGSSAVGRSILLAIGKFKAFTASVLIAGAVNVIASYCFVKYLGWGLRGIVLGTIVAVVGRCLVWMPWYVLRALRAERAGNE